MEGGPSGGGRAAAPLPADFLEDDGWRSGLHAALAAPIDAGPPRERSVAKVQKFVNRIRQHGVAWGDAGGASALDELRRLDVTMHLSEVVTAICEAPAKLRDLPATLALCVELARRYGGPGGALPAAPFDAAASDVAKTLVAAVHRTFRSTTADVTARGGHRRFLLRFMFELVLIGLVAEAQGLPPMIQDLCGGAGAAAVSGGPNANAAAADTPPLPATSLVMHNVASLDILCKKLGPAIFPHPCADQIKCALKKRTQVALRAKLVHFLATLGADFVPALQHEEEEMAALIVQRTLNRGAANSEALQAKERFFQTSRSKTIALIISLCSSLEQDPSQLNTGNKQWQSALEAEGATAEKSGVAAANEPADGGTAGVAANGSADLKPGYQQVFLSEEGGVEVAVWESEEEAEFYCNVLDLSEVLPATLLASVSSASSRAEDPQKPGRASGFQHALSSGPGGAPGSHSGRSNAGAGGGEAVAEICGDSGSGSGRDGGEAADASAATPVSRAGFESADAPGFASVLGDGSFDGGDASFSELGDAFSPCGGGSGAAVGDAPRSPSAAASETRVQQLEQLISASLAAAQTAGEVDQIAMQYFYAQFRGSKALRRRTAKLLISSAVPAAAAARFLATVAPFAKDVVAAATTAAWGELRGLLAAHDAQKEAAVLHAGRQLAELAKFRLLPAGQLLSLLSELLVDFSQQRLLLACELLQDCGRFLRSVPGGARKFNAIIDQLLRLKTVRLLPAALEQRVDDAFFACFPERRQPVAVEQPLPLQLYANHLVHAVLHEARRGSEEVRIALVLNAIRRLDWEGDAAVAACVKSAFLDAGAAVALEHLATCAALLQAVLRGRPAFGVSCIDAVLERMQRDLELADFKRSPVRIRDAKFLGELFKCRLIDSATVLDTLYNFVGFEAVSSYGAASFAAFEKVAKLSGNAQLLAEPTAEREVAKGGSGNRAASAAMPPGGATAGTGTAAAPTAATAATAAAGFPLDPPRPLVLPQASAETLREGTFRLRLACVLLDTAGIYMAGSWATRLDLFLLVLQRFFLTLGPLPAPFRFMMEETVDPLRAPGSEITMASSLADVDRALQTVLHKQTQLAQQVPGHRGHGPPNAGPGAATAGAGESDEHSAAATEDFLGQSASGDSRERQSRRRPPREGSPGMDTDRSLASLSSLESLSSSLEHRSNRRKASHMKYASGAGAGGARVSGNAGGEEDAGSSDGLAPPSEEEVESEVDSEASLSEGSSSVTSSVATSSTTRGSRSRRALADLEFDAGFAQVVNESLHAARVAGGSSGAVKLPNWRQVLGELREAKGAASGAGGGAAAGARARGGGDGSYATLCLLGRRRGRVGTRQIWVPSRSKITRIAYSGSSGRDGKFEQEEHARLKRFVLDTVQRGRRKELSEKEAELRRDLFRFAPAASPMRRSRASAFDPAPVSGRSSRAGPGPPASFPEE